MHLLGLLWVTGSAAVIEILMLGQGGQHLDEQRDDAIAAEFSQRDVKELELIEEAFCHSRSLRLDDAPEQRDPVLVEAFGGEPGPDHLEGTACLADLPCRHLEVLQIEGDALRNGCLGRRGNDQSAAGTSSHPSDPAAFEDAGGLAQDRSADTVPVEKLSLAGNGLADRPAHRHDVAFDGVCHCRGERLASAVAGFGHLPRRPNLGSQRV
jgi:hypothetical protein